MDLDVKELESAIEGILFASGEPVQIDRICTALDLDRPTTERILQKLMDYYAYERRGIRLLRMEDSWQLCSSPDYADVIRKAFEIRKPAKLSPAGAGGPDHHRLLSAHHPGLRGPDPGRGQRLYRGPPPGPGASLRSAGRLQVPGRPHLYRTTKKFLRAFHLTSLDDLPEMPDLAEEGQLRLGEDGALIDPENAVREDLPSDPPEAETED